VAPAIQIENISKRYVTEFALSDITIGIQQGAFGLIGPNGAGKTTLIKLICGLLRPTSGTISIKGHRPGSPGANASIGYLSEHQGYYEFKSPNEYLRYFGELYGLSRSEMDKSIPRLLGMVNLRNNAADPISTFSRGMRQRVGIARAMLHDPDFYILDEPLSGLDPTGRRDVLRILTRLKEAGRTILLSSHELKDMDVFCDEICILRKGRKIAQGNPNSLMSNVKDAREMLAFNLHSPSEVLPALPREIPGILAFEVSPGGFQVTIPHDPALERRILRWLLVKKVDFSVKKHVIDSLYTHLFEEQPPAQETVQEEDEAATEVI